jgi:nucleoside-diphosphate-sugar epimerase
MNLLILGGTKFVGRHITATALMRGHHVTLFNRGQSNPNLFPDAEKISGNRDGGLDALPGRTWDAVLDINGYLPRIVGASADLLKNSVERYIFISTISVFADFTIAGQNEDAPLAQLQDPTTEVIDGETYGGLKVACEQVVQKTFPGGALILRPGYVVGPNDHTDRMTSWWRRITRGGEMLAPGNPNAPIQFIDGRDLAAFAMDMTERHAIGIYNLNGVGSRLSWGECFDHVQFVTGTDTNLTWVSEEFLKAQTLGEGDLPMFAFSEEASVMTFNNHKAVSAGLHFRPISDTIRDTLIWDAAEGGHKLGLALDREQELLRAWQAYPNPAE